MQLLLPPRRARLGPFFAGVHCRADSPVYGEEVASDYDAHHVVGPNGAPDKKAENYATQAGYEEPQTYVRPGAFQLPEEPYPQGGRGDVHSHSETGLPQG